MLVTVIIPQMMMLLPRSKYSVHDSVTMSRMKVHRNKLNIRFAKEMTSNNVTILLLHVEARIDLIAPPGTN